MKILAIDTTQETCSSALQVDGKLYFREVHAPREHTRLLLPQVDDLLKEAGLKPAGLDAIAFGRGPGSFTGLRIAAGVAQGLALGAGIPVAAVSSLAGLAQRAFREYPETTRVAAAFDARIDEVYCGCFILEDGLAVPLDEESVIAPQQFVLAGKEEDKWLAAGSGWQAYPQMLQRLEGRIAACHADMTPLARDLLPLAVDMISKEQTVSAGQALPVYLRNKVAQTIAERNKGS